MAGSHPHESSRRERHGENASRRSSQGSSQRSAPQEGSARRRSSQEESVRRRSPQEGSVRRRSPQEESVRPASSNGSDVSVASWHSAYVVQDPATGAQRLTDNDPQYAPPPPVPQNTPELPADADAGVYASNYGDGTFFAVSRVAQSVRMWVQEATLWVGLEQNQKLLRDLLLDFTPNTFQGAASIWTDHELPLQVAGGVAGFGVSARDFRAGYQHFQETGEIFTMNNFAGASRATATVLNITSAATKPTHDLPSRLTGAFGSLSAAFAAGLDVAASNTGRQTSQRRAHRPQEREDVGNERGGHELRTRAEGPRAEVSSMAAARSTGLDLRPGRAVTAPVTGDWTEARSGARRQGRRGRQPGT
ncbi:hypothetical protein [Streptomyces sp. NPDC088789]|uniref:hypothetical protein n=1 Tax=Streptomyces sp. NPDC088789 TaxID=3365899 RepID=UPI0038249BC9